MIRRAVIALLFLLLGLSPVYPLDSRTWQKIGFGITDAQIHCLAVSPDGQIIFAGTSAGIYKSNNQGKNFSPVFQTSGSSQDVNFLYIDPSQPDFIYAATQAGLFLSTDNGNRWQGIFNPQDARARQCLSVIVDNQTIYMGTLDGLFIKESNSPVWQKKKELLSNFPVTFILSDPHYIYFTTPDELFRIDKQDQTHRKIFSMTSQELNIETSSEEFSDNSTFFTKQIKFMTQSIGQSGSLYLATSKGIFFSDNHGDHWQQMTANSLPYEEITSLLVLNLGEILSGTNEGLFHYDKERWTQLYQGLETNEVNYLAADHGGQVYLAADSGIFLMTNEKTFANNIPFDYAEIETKFSSEPTIEQTQAMAIEYAEVHPRKIERWRKLARTKALLPTVSVGLDRSASELLHWDTGGNPDTLVKGKDILEWDVSVSWNLGELIWNNDQTSIDSRSKLMVELREDVLDQVTRLYFERRRLQAALMSVTETAGPPFDQQMRVAELTALIDALTGGKFSAQLKSNR